MEAHEYGFITEADFRKWSCLPRRLAGYIPVAALAGILMVVAYNMGEWREIPQLLKLTKTDISLWVVTPVGVLLQLAGLEPKATVCHGRRRPPSIASRFAAWSIGQSL
jgi:hypothetical protein